MKIISIKKNIHSFNVLSDLVIESRQNIIKLSSNSFVANIEDATRILKFNDCLVVLNSLNKGFLIDGNQFLNDRIIDCTNKYILTYSKTPQTYSIFNTNLECLFSEKNSFGRHIFGELVVLGIGDSEKIIIRDISQNKTKYEFTLLTLGTWQDGTIEKPYQVAEFSGIYENTLVCSLTNGDILLLDFEKGEVKAFFKDVFVKRNLQPSDNESSIFWGLSFVTFIEIDVATGTILRHVNLENYLRDFYSHPSLIAFNTTICENGLIYFQASYNIVGIFDPSTCKILDFYEFDFDPSKGQQLKGGKENLQVKDGKIYCLDTLGNLYELER